MNQKPANESLAKTPTGISGFDKITDGGLPQGRCSLVCGGAGCGKTLFGMEFLVRGARDYGEPGVFFSFEESEAELTSNFASMNFDIESLTAAGTLLIQHVRVDRRDLVASGEYDLEGLFIRLDRAISLTGARRVVLDTLEVLFGGLDDQFLLRSELRRLFNWLKERGVTAVVTAEGDRGSLTRHGLEEFVSDCVIFLDHRITDQLTTRRLRIVKYRGSAHETNEFPFILDNDGITVLPITAVLLDYQISKERVTSGFASLDAMLGGQGYFRGSSVLVSGTAGTGKTTMAALFVDAACRRGERALYFAFEEPAGQIVRNLRSVGVDLQQWLDQGLLKIQAVRPTMFGLENHLTLIHRNLGTFKPDVVVLDPVTNFTAVSSQAGAKSLLVRLVDYFKRNQITTVFTSLTSGGAPAEETEVGISSLIDTWLVLRIHELDHRRQLTLTIVKSRGMPHETQSQRMIFTEEGLVLEPITPPAAKDD